MDLDNTNAPYLTVHRKGRLLVSRLDAGQVSKINQSMDFAYGLVACQNASAKRPSPVTEAFVIQDKRSDALHLLWVHRLDYRPPAAPRVGEIVVFSKPEHAISEHDCLQLGTPAFYRTQEDLKQGLRDQHDGVLTKDAREWARKIMRSANVDGASVSFAATREPWVWCASHFRSKRELLRLKEHFSKEYEYTAATRIADPDTCALWLGIDFALSLQQSTLVRRSALDQFGYEQSSCRSIHWEGSRPLDTFVRVYHGPVNYSDEGGQIATQENWFDPYAGAMAWFTKKRAFQMQSEYRFAISTLGDPIEPRLHIVVSPEMRAATVYGERV